MNGIKPSYKVPSMAEIESIPWNGYNVVSTFSGGGGSCLGYRMAGYHVIWANEFVEEAQKTYRANHKHTILNTKDIRTVTAQEILDETGMARGEIDLFDGSPPCCAFSMAGSREKGWGKEHNYSDVKQSNIEDLFEEYIRLLSGLQPKTFVAENVSGMVKGTAIGYFKQYIKKMKNCGYRVKAQLLNSKWLGVPQSRERIIFVGVRNDLNLDPVYPKPLPYYYALKDCLNDVKNDEKEVEMLLTTMKRTKQYEVIKKIPNNPKKIIKGSKVMNGSWFNTSKESMYFPCSTVTATNGNPSTAGLIHPLYDRKFTIEELKRITSIPDDFILTGQYKQQGERLGRMVPPVMMMHIAKTIQTEILDKL